MTGCERNAEQQQLQQLTANDYSNLREKYTLGKCKQQTMAGVCWWLAIAAVLYCVLSEQVVLAQQSGLYAENELQQTVFVGGLSAKKRQHLSNEMLQVLGVGRPGRVRNRRTLAPPQYMVDLYRSLTDENTDSRRQRLAAAGVTADDVVMSFTSKGALPNGFGYQFDMSDVSNMDAARHVTLRLYKAATVNHTVEVEVHMAVGKQTIATVAEISGSHEGWMEFDVTTLLKDIAQKVRSLAKVNVAIKTYGLSRADGEMEPAVAGVVGWDGPAERQAFIVGFFKAEEKKAERKKRAARRSDDVTFNDDQELGPYTANYYAANKRSCQRKALYVNFKELGWQDWIIAPEGYTAFYCTGECSFPLNAHMNATNHAIVQTLVHLMQPTKAPKPCCAPTKLSPVSVLYFDDVSNVVLRNYKNMAVRSCGCH